jgi:hypothetical protein
VKVPREVAYTVSEPKRKQTIQYTCSIQDTQ